MKNYEPLSEEILLNLEAEYDSPEKVLLAKEANELHHILVDEFLETLTERQRNVFLLKHCSNPKLKAEQIGEKLGISASAVGSAFADANAALARWKKANGY